MLHYNAIEATTLGLLIELQKLPSLSVMRLVGGTSLALQMGHRKSVDIDLFGELQGDWLSLSKELGTDKKTILIHQTKSILIQYINGIKVDIVNYPYPWISDEIRDGQIRLATRQDIAAMKLSAITNRGTKKDFYDIYFLLKTYPLKEMLKFYSKKYHDGNVYLVLKSLTYFDDAEKDGDPEMLMDVDWNKVKSKIIKAVKKL